MDGLRQGSGAAETTTVHLLTGHSKHPAGRSNHPPIGWTFDTHVLASPGLCEASRCATVQRAQREDHEPATDVPVLASALLGLVLDSSKGVHISAP